MSATEVQNLVDNASELITLPQVAIRVNEFANDPDST